MNLDQILQIITLLGFFIGMITFCINTGGYKKGIERDIDLLKIEINENKKEIKNLRENEFKILQEDVKKLRDENIKDTKRVEALLIEVKTKLEFFMQMSGVFGKDSNE